MCVSERLYTDCHRISVCVWLRLSCHAVMDVLVMSKHRRSLCALVCFFTSRAPFQEKRVQDATDVRFGLQLYITRTLSVRS